MVILILPVLRTACHILPAKGRLQLQLCQVRNRSSYHTFKSKMIRNLGCGFPGQVFPCHLKTDSVSFREGICHSGNGLLRKSRHIPGRLKLIFTDILAVCIEISDIAEITVINDIKYPAPVYAKHVTNGNFSPVLRIVTGMPIQDISDFLFLRSLPLSHAICKCGINLRKQFHACHQILFVAVIDITNQIAQLAIQQAQGLPEVLSQFLHRIGGITKGRLIILGKDILIQLMIASLKLFQRSLLQTAATDKSSSILQKKKEIGLLGKIGIQTCPAQFFHCNFPNSLQHQSMALCQNTVAFLFRKKFLLFQICLYFCHLITSPALHSRTHIQQKTDKTDGKKIQYRSQHGKQPEISVIPHGCNPQSQTNKRKQQGQKTCKAIAHSRFSATPVRKIHHNPQRHQTYDAQNR